MSRGHCRRRGGLTESTHKPLRTAPGAQSSAESSGLWTVSQQREMQTSSAQALTCLRLLLRRGGGLGEAAPMQPDIRQSCVDLNSPLSENTRETLGPVLPRGHRNLKRQALAGYSRISEGRQRPLVPCLLLVSEWLQHGSSGEVLGLLTNLQFLSRTVGTEACAFKKQGEVTVNHITSLCSRAVKETSSLL